MKTPAPRWVFYAAYPALYAAFDVISHVRPALGPGITPWDPQAGLTLVFLLACGWRGLPVAIGVALLAHLLHQGAADPEATVIAVSLNTLALASLTAFLSRTALSPPWSSVEAATRFAAASAVTSGMGALCFGLTFYASGTLAADDLLTATFRMAFAQLTGILTVAPLFLWLLETPSIRSTAQAWRSRLALAQAATLLAMLAVLLMLAPAWQLRFFYLLLIPVVWIALRWGWAGALTAVLTTHLVLVGAVKLQLHTPRFIDLQVLMLALALVATVLGMAVKERGEALRRAQERDAALARGLRVAMAGGLASALAHELNQPITALVSYLRSAQILASAPAPDPALLQGTVSKAADEALRTSAVLRRLRDFYQDREVRREAVPLDETCASVAATLESRLRREGTHLTLRLAAQGVSVAADRTHLEIVLFNLLSNAADAVAARGGGRREILLRTQVVGAAAQMSVEDSGEGIAAALADRMFEPFVTSKNDGMGLGLAISRELTRRFGGELHVTHAADLGGAAFTVYLERR